MFSGIIDAIGEIRSVRDAPGGKSLVVRAAGYWADLKPGASVAIDGACLTVTHADAQDAQFDVIAETLRRTTLGGLRPGDRINLQKSLAVGDRIDGHFVQGHVDAVATIAEIRESGGESIWWFSLAPEASPTGQVPVSIVPKGSIAVDGISLTVVAVRQGGFSVALIPTTLRGTTLGHKKPGARVNVETDILARTVVQYLQLLGVGTGPHAAAANDAAMMDLLKREGFA
ncbi:MAG TPA: riboflavin synthase [Phycisphaerae bacterium]|nr:riboflavin synthase [Phycisphaerae bacterium]